MRDARASERAEEGPQLAAWARALAEILEACARQGVGGPEDGVEPGREGEVGGARTQRINPALPPPLSPCLLTR